MRDSSSIVANRGITIIPSNSAYGTSLLPSLGKKIILRPVVSVLDQDGYPVLRNTFPEGGSVFVCESTWRSANKKCRAVRFLNPRSRRRRISSSSVHEKGVAEMAPKDDNIAVDPNFYSMKRDLEPDDFQSETTSIASAIAKGRFENGRRYQATKEDDYWGPSDEQQFEAFEISHILFLVLDYYQPNALFHAPIGDSPKHILDIGTGKGSWAIDVADFYPTATIRGVDLFPPPVTWMPPNCVFEVDDVLKDWTWREPFDFIHMRMMYGAFDSEGWNQVYKRAYDALAPGGWIEQVEFDIRCHSDDGTLKENSLLGGWGDLFLSCSAQAGRTLTTQETMRGAMEKAGFVDAHEKLYKIPLGPWAKDKILKEAGHLHHAHWNAALEGWAMWLLTQFGEPVPWTNEEVQVYLAKVRLELKNPHTHGWNYGRRVWARKPTEKELMAKHGLKSEPYP